MSGIIDFCNRGHPPHNILQGCRYCRDEDLAMKNHTETEWLGPRTCDFCSRNEQTVEASFDGKTIYGPWALMCQDHFSQYGIGLGLGKGQRLLPP